MKTKTEKGKPVAKYSLLAEFKPEHQRANPETGEVKERWTYRSDLENEKYSNAHNGEAFAHELNVLGHIANRDKKKYSRARLFANHKPKGEQLLAEWVNGKLNFPHEGTSERIKFENWIKPL